MSTHQERDGHDSTKEEIIKEVAKILATGYLNLLAKKRQDITTAAAADEPPAAPKPARRMALKQSKPADTRLPPLSPRSERVPITGAPSAAIAEKLKRLSEMATKELKAEYEGSFGRRPQSSNRQSLLRRIAWETQAQIEGCLPEAVRDYACQVAEHTDLFRRIEENLKKRDASTTSPEMPHARPRKQRPATRISKPRDPRLPAPGSLLILKRGRETVRVTVLKTGFEYAGQKYRSLTAVGRAVAGHTVNAFEFFGLARVPGC